MKGTRMGTSNIEKANAERARRRDERLALEAELERRHVKQVEQVFVCTECGAEYESPLEASAHECDDPNDHTVVVRGGFAESPDELKPKEYVEGVMGVQIRLPRVPVHEPKPVGNATAGADGRLPTFRFDNQL